jgi:hypothetical protein
MKNSIFLLIICILGFNPITKADSPLTSTDIASAYKNEKIVMSAALANGVLNDELILFLNGKSNPIYLKIAVINKLGWNINGKNEAEVFWQHLKKNNKFKSIEDFKKKGTAEQLICYAYLKALDNYNDVEEAMAYAQIAVKKDKKASYTINIICGLIEAQYYFNGNWCMLWKSTNKVRNNKKLNVDLAPEAIKNIFEYMDLYKGEC